MCTYCFFPNHVEAMCTWWGNIFTKCFLPSHLEWCQRVVSMHNSNRPILFPCHVQSNDTDKTGHAKHDLFVHLSSLRPKPKCNCFLPSHLEVSMSHVYARTWWTGSISISSLAWHKKRHVMSNTASLSILTPFSSSPSLFN